MIKHIQISILLGIYGKLLTNKQLEVMNYYYNEDLSLSEIAEKYGSSRQAIQDLIKKGESKLLFFESRLGMMQKSEVNRKKVKLIAKKMNQLKTCSKDELETSIDSINRDINSIVE